jgi:putative sterol carrier protein
LTDDWLTELASAAEGVAVPPEVRLTVQQVVLDGAREVVYALVLGDGAMSVRAGRVDAPDVTLTQDRATAEQIRAGTLSAQVAFLDGRLRLSGDAAALRQAGAPLATLDDALALSRA